MQQWNKESLIDKEFVKRELQRELLKKQQQQQQETVEDLKKKKLRAIKNTATHLLTRKTASKLSIVTGLKPNTVPLLLSTFSNLVNVKRLNLMKVSPSMKNSLRMLTKMSLKMMTSKPSTILTMMTYQSKKN